MELFILRHMQTDYNKRGILQGKRDIPIIRPDTGQDKIIRRNKKQMGDLAAFDHILVSTLQRTRMTAAYYVTTFTVEPLLDELDFGKYEGRKKEDLIHEQPLWTDRPDRLSLGEPLLNLEKRIRQFVEAYDSASKILLFGHGAWIRALVSWVHTGSIRGMNAIQVPNNELIRLRRGG